ncbi:hypothetical protein P9847_01330 [Paenibacillus chibensis]|uniref:Uncharacterized protein n=1 Tax=Paenibacillus chibensis TaxID=59846 RepID=A0ABU6PM44_9BACL|nr:hypothetical protein [Paenibacillus chibensis]
MNGEKLTAKIKQLTGIADRIMKDFSTDIKRKDFYDQQILCKKSLIHLLIVMKLNTRFLLELQGVIDDLEGWQRSVETKRASKRAAKNWKGTRKILNQLVHNQRRNMDYFKTLMDKYKINFSMNEIQAVFSIRQEKIIHKSGTIDSSDVNALAKLSGNYAILFQSSE